MCNCATYSPPSNAASPPSSRANRSPATCVRWVASPPTARNNVALIHAQRPDATRVAGYRAWQALGRQVRKGERGIRIIAPFRIRVEAEEVGADKEIVTGYAVRTVFDWLANHGRTAAPTTRPRRTHRRCDNGGDRPHGTDRVATGAGRAGHAHRHGAGKRLLLAHPREIAVHRDLTGVRQVKTLVHEAAHFAADHCGGIAYENAETVAEGAAYVVLTRFALDTSGYSFATWRTGRGRWRPSGATLLPSSRRRSGSSLPSKGGGVSMARRFSTPTILLTPAAMDVLVRAATPPMTIAARHFAGEWGDPPADAVRNEAVLRQGQGTVLSVFAVGSETVHVVSYIGQGKTRTPRSCSRTNTDTGRTDDGAACDLRDARRAVTYETKCSCRYAPRSGTRPPLDHPSLLRPPHPRPLPKQPEVPQTGELTDSTKVLQ